MAQQSNAGSSTPRSRRDDVVDAQKREFGGIKFGSAFFGWMTAIGIAVLLTAVLSAIGLSVGLANDTGAHEAADQTSQNAQTIGIIGAIVFAVILFIAYYCGGYVAGRMARFNGAKQGFAVWLWAIIIAIVLAIITAIAGDKFDVMNQIGGLPQIPVSSDMLTASGFIALAIAVLIPLLAAILGGKAGMGFHRKVDQASINHQHDRNS
ncbi:hypothetical protein [Paeniglutamicibacter antarcticus]|uniref:Major facilitator superfamily (MFS) profile domain-containing protein n=1 Tax=Paeniglutamicibacter antarcticus TaxID=494023 RepID=A0ABP9TP02_9MICC